MPLRPVALSAFLLLGVSHTALAQATLPDVVVEAPRSSPAASPDGNRWVVVDRAFSPVTVVSQDEIRSAGASSLGDLLMNEPGITGSGFAPGSASRPVIRGLDNNRVRIQENGIGSGDVSELGEDHAVSIDPLAAQSVEVVRGPAALRFGSQAIGGVVNVSNNRIPTSLGPVGVRGQLTGAGATAEGAFEGSAILDGRKGNVAFHAEIFGRSSGDYTIPGGGKQANSFTSASGFSLGATAFFDQGFFGVSVTHLRNLYGIPGTAAADRTRINMEQTKVQARGEYQLDGGPFEVFRFWMGGSNYKHDEESAATGAFVVGSTFRNFELEARGEGQMRTIATPLGNLTNLIGVQAGTQRLTTDGEATGLLSPAETRKIATYLFSTLELTRSTRLQAAGRIETVTIDGTAATVPADFLGASGALEQAGASRNFVPMSASLGLLQDLPGGIVASITGQYVERAPRAAELFSRGPHEATTTFEIGNPNLTKESARSIELGLKKATGAWRFDATAFHSVYNGFIFKRGTGNQCDDTFDTCGTGTELTQIVYDQRDATFTGAELRSQLDVAQIGGGTLGIEGRYDFVNAVFTDNTNLPRIPPHRLGGGVYWRDANWFARAFLLHAFDQNAIATGETPTAGYNLLNAELSYRHKVKDPNSGIKEVIVGLNGRNLLDETIRNHVSFTKNEVVAPGRSVRLFATVKF